MAAPTPTPALLARGRSSAGARVPAPPGARPTNLLLHSFGGSQKMNHLTEANWWIYCIVLVHILILKIIFCVKHHLIYTSLYVTQDSVCNSKGTGVRLSGL